MENAIEFAADHLAPPLSLDLKKILWDVETEKYENIKESLDVYLESWRKWNMEFLSSGPVFAMLLEGIGAVSLVRKITGFTFPSDALPGTIRGDSALDSAYESNLQKRATGNLLHASGTVKEAEFERKLWFKEKDIYKY